MKHYIIYLFALFTSLTAFSQFSITGGQGTPYDYKDQDRSSNLEHIFLLNTLDGATLTFTSESGSVQFYKYQQSPDNRVPIPNSDINYSIGGATSTYEIRNIESDHGYIAEYIEHNNTRTRSVWITDYSKYTEEFGSLSINEAAEDKCSFVDLIFEKNSQPIRYFDAYGGREMTRKYMLEYSDLRWDGNNKQYIEEDKTDTLNSSFKIKAPLINTDFVLSGDLFAEHFGIAKVTSPVFYSARKVEAHIVSEPSDTAVSPDSYSAPIDFNFYSNANTPVANSFRWKIYHNTNPETNPDDYLISYNDEDISYTFTEAGKYTIVLDINKDQDCDFTETTESFNILESFLNFPNFLSPGTSSSGDTNIFRASYRSLTRFKCTIFNRWGNKIYQWDDPKEGWDGTYKGKLVSPGVYFYVVDAEGSDGVRYKKGGDINVIHGRGNNGFSQQE